MGEDNLLEEKKSRLEWWKARGIEPYGRKYPKTEISAIAARREGEVQTAGRLMNLRKHGKAAFGDIADRTGKIQIYFKKDAVGEDQWTDFCYLDVGDIIGVKGELFTTHTGQLTVLVKEFKLLSKILRTLPEKWHGLKDVEIRYRRRYLDLTMNRDVQNIFLLRTKILALIRDLLNSDGYIEVETPMMHPIAGGAEAKPFVTHHNALDMDLYLRIAPELYLKRLLVGGLERVYEINRSFRNEGISTLHNPEFTMLEVYSAYGDYEEMIDLTERIILSLAEKIYNSDEVEYQGEKISLKRPWKRILWQDVWKTAGITDWKDVNQVKEKVREHHLDTEGKENIFELLDLLFKKKIEPGFIQPTFVTGYPKEISPLAKSCPDDPDITERFELYIKGLELANGYSELNDPAEQKARFEKEVALAGPDRPKIVDEDYVEALEHAMPPAGGLGIGIDRLTMIFTGADSIREVILFPLLRPKT